MKREFTGVFIPAHIWTSKLLPAEKMLLGEVAALSQKTGWCDASREHFAEWLHCDVTNVTHYVKKLEGLGFLEVSRTPGFRSKMRVKTDAFYIAEVVNPVHGGSESRSRGVVNPVHGGSESRSPEIKDKYNLKEKGKDTRAELEKLLTLNAENKSTQKEISRPAPPPTAFDTWVDVLAGDYRIREGFTITQKIPGELFEDYVTRFTALARTQPEKYSRKHDLTGHFLNWSRIQFQEQSKQKQNGSQKFTFDLNKSVDGAAEWLEQYKREMAAERAMRGY